MRILCYFSHPSQFLFYKNPIINLRHKGHYVFILIKTKDILADLLNEIGWEYQNILPDERGNSRFSIFKSLIIRDIRVLYFSRKIRAQLLMGTDASLAHAGKILGIPCVSTSEDDYTVIKNLANLTYPFTKCILTPTVCDVGRWDKKKIGYQGYMKLSYLHPNVFSPDKSLLSINMNRPYFLIRLSALVAHHDFGEKGICDEVLDAIIRKLEPKGNIFITSEKRLPQNYEKYRLRIPVLHIHHYLYFAELLICDSQSMAVEAAALGTPSIRISSFSGRISVLEELEHKYQLTFGIKPGNKDAIFNKFDELFKIEKFKDEFQARRQKMLSDKIDVSAFLTWFIDSYPASAEIMKKDPNYQHRFK